MFPNKFFDQISGIVRELVDLHFLNFRHLLGHWVSVVRGDELCQYFFFFLQTLECHTGCTRPPASLRTAGGGRGRALLPTTEYEPDVVETDRDIGVWSWPLWIFGEKCLVGDVTVGGGWVVSTSSFRFPVGHDLNRLTCSGDCLGNVYFQFGERSKIVRTQISTFLKLLRPCSWRHYGRSGSRIHFRFSVSGSARPKSLVM